MDVITAPICRFCLKVCEYDFQPIEEVTHGILSFLLLNLDLGITSEPVACNSCVDNLKECFDFKAACLHMEDADAVFSDKKIDVKFNRAKMPQKEEKNFISTTNACNGSSICCFCMTPIKQESFVLNDCMNMTAMIEKYFPEMDLKLTEESIACISCYNSLQHHFTVISCCVNAEEKITEYCGAEGTSNKGQVELSNVLQFTLRNAIDSEDNSQDKWHHNRVKNKITEVFIKSENFTEEQERSIEQNKVVIKTEQSCCDRFQDNTFFLQPQTPGYVTTYKLEVIMYNCITCTYQTKHKSYIQKHALTHKSIKDVTMYRCAMCEFETKRKDHLQRHTLIHRRTSEVTMYKCDLCEFQAKRKDHLDRHKQRLKQHVLPQKTTSEETVYNCAHCTYQTKRRYNLQTHMLVHNSEAIVYKCQICEFYTKHKRNLKQHMLTHESIPEEKMYKCTKCVFRANHKGNLQRHMLTHYSTSEVTMYKCELCEFQTKHKRNLKLHVLIHKNTSEVKMYKCTECSHESYHKGNLQKHMLIHRSLSEVTMYQCETCGHQTKHKHTLKRHLLTHRNLLKEVIPDVNVI